MVGETLYGTAVRGGKYHDGTVYSLGLRGNEHWVYSFRSEDSPYAGLVNLNGTLYGTTISGGDGTCPYSGPGCGTVYAITTSGKEKTIYSFKGGTDGANPWSGLVDVNRKLYGVTYGGGYENNGTVFSVTTSGVEHVLHTFGQNYDGSAPLGVLIYASGLLYGTTQSGGNGEEGTVFSVTTAGQEQVLYSFGNNGAHDASHPVAGLLYLNGELYGTSEQGGDKEWGTVFEVSTSGQEHVLYSFKGAADGGAPQSQLRRDKRRALRHDLLARQVLQLRHRLRLNAVTVSAPRRASRRHKELDARQCGRRAQPLVGRC